MTLTAAIFAMSLSRKIKPEEIRMLLKRLYVKDSNALEKYMFHYKHLYPKNYERFIKTEYENLKETKN